MALLLEFKYYCMYKNYFLFLIPVFFFFAGNAQKRNKTIAVLIVDGFSNHDWRQTTKITQHILEKSGLFTVSVSTVPEDSVGKAIWNPEFNKYSVVIQNTNNINNNRLRWPRNVEKKLEDYVRKGGGLYVLHSANNSFSHWAAYNNMIGLGWRPKSFGYALEIDVNKNIISIPPGEGSNTGHGKRFDAVIEQFTTHPINKGYPKRWKTANTEIYHYPRGPAQNLTILSYAYDSVATHRYWPVEWLVKYGKGNVYTSSLGHLWQGETYPVAYRCIGFQTTMIRVMQWLATGKVSYPIPSNFPTEEKISLTEESNF